ncbi:DUF6261 family protein [Reichenbachiella versicolor]|uniref:DUF6261 family protein n=1 Tax=Reichenbachiella versicolor TaxID=1821036 RepID=UPI0013A5523D|nr:DUF6261 family protein [Reichenbachiella versicolor]
MQIAAEYEALKSSSDELVILMKPELGNALTKDLESEDTRRDSAFTGFSTVVSGYTYHYDESLKAHADNLSKQIGLYGSGIARQNYQEQTGTLTSLISDIKTKPEMSEAITALNLSSWITEIESANVAFSDLYIARNKSMVNESPESVKEKRNAMMSEYYTLRDMITALNTIKKGTEPFTTAIAELNGIINSYNQILDKRKKNNSETEVEG